MTDCACGSKETCEMRQTFAMSMQRSPAESEITHHTSPASGYLDPRRLTWSPKQLCWNELARKPSNKNPYQFQTAAYSNNAPISFFPVVLFKHNQTPSDVFLINHSYRFQSRGPRSRSPLFCFSICETNEQFNVAFLALSVPIRPSKHLMASCRDSLMTLGTGETARETRAPGRTGINQRHHFIQPVGDCDVFVHRYEGGGGNISRQAWRGNAGCLGNPRLRKRGPPEREAGTRVRRL